MSKSKEIVLCKSRGRCLLSSPEVICNIEQVEDVTLLWAWFNSRLSFSAHVIDHVLSTVNQSFHLLNRLRRLGLDSFDLSVNVCNVLVLVISKLTHGYQAFSGFLSSSELCRLQAYLNKAYKYKLSLIRHDIKFLYEDIDVQFFNRIQSNPDHCSLIVTFAC
jgi:hypothetical protein